MKTSVFSKMVAILAVLSVPTASFAGPSCTNLCGMNANTAKSYINDAKCKNDPKCVDCVVNSMIGGQSGAYCTAATKSKKGSTIEMITAGLNGAAAVACGVACFSQVGDRLCGIGGLAVMATEVATTIVGLTKGDQGLMSLVSLAPQALTAKSNIAMIKMGSEKVARKAVDGAKTEATKQSNLAACINMVMYGITAYAKVKSKAKMDKTHDSACLSAQHLASVSTGATQACTQGATPNAPPVVDLQGLFTTTKDTSYATPTVDDIDRLAATGSTKFLRDMKDDLRKLEEMGKLNLADVSKRMESGEKPSALLSGMGFSGDALEELKRQEERIDRGEKSPLLAALVGDSGYSDGGGATVADSGGMGFGEVGFGDTIPGEGATATLEIDRQPSEARKRLGAGDDIFHSAFPGTIFDIVSLRIKESKDTYAELDPEGRMNRVFNGYSDPAARAPASAKQGAARKGEAR